MSCSRCSEARYHCASCPKTIHDCTAYISGAMVIWPRPMITFPLTTLWSHLGVHIQLKTITKILLGNHPSVYKFVQGHTCMSVRRGVPWKLVNWDAKLCWRCLEAIRSGSSWASADGTSGSLSRPTGSKSLTCSGACILEWLWEKV